MREQLRHSPFLRSDQGEGGLVCTNIQERILWRSKVVSLAAELLRFNKRILIFWGNNICVGTKYNFTSVKKTGRTEGLNTSENNRALSHFTY